MVKPPTAVTLVRNSVAPSDNPKLDATPATTKVGTMAEEGRRGRIRGGGGRGGGGGGRKRERRGEIYFLLLEAKQVKAWGYFMG